MASTYYKLVASENPSTDGTSEVILEKDEDGNTVKSVGVNKPAQLTQDDRDKLEALGYEVESSSKEEADEAEEAAVVSSSALASAPLIGRAPQNQAVPAASDDSDENKS